MSTTDASQNSPISSAAKLGVWPEKKGIFGVLVSVTTYEDATARIVAAAKQRRPSCVDFTPLNILTDAAYDEGFRDRINEYDMTCPDGAPVWWYLNHYYDARIPAPVTGTGTTLRVCEAVAREGISVYLYGSTPEVIEKLKVCLLTRFPALRIAGAESPPFRPLTVEEDEAMVRRANESGAGVFLISLGSPKQESFAHEHRDRIQAVQMCVGAAFDFISGNKKRAPRWMQQAGMEWVFRLAREPHRLFKRVLLGNTRFFWLLVTRRPGR
jgi:N-acetylglucosaminyldiphosphoundecaprenol N-acetyl-beta-D-mannosaminyltransferase